MEEGGSGDVEAPQASSRRGRCRRGIPRGTSSERVRRLRETQRGWEMKVSGCDLRGSRQDVVYAVGIGALRPITTDRRAERTSARPALHAGPFQVQACTLQHRIGRRVFIGGGRGDGGRCCCDRTARRTETAVCVRVQVTRVLLLVLARVLLMHVLLVRAGQLRGTHGRRRCRGEHV